VDGMEITNVFVSGVGGQGLVLATKIISDVAFREGYDIKTSDVIGLSQRGGMVWGSVRFGKDVPSSLIPQGKGDILIALEALEGLRWTPLLKKDAHIILSREEIYPNRVLIEKDEYPESIEPTLKNMGFDVIPVDSNVIAKELGNLKVTNTILLGVLSTLLPFKVETWEDSIRENVPQKTIELNLSAFKRGRELVL